MKRLRMSKTGRAPESVTIQKAKPEEMEAILEVMRPWNMHHVPSPEMESVDLSCFFVARVAGRVIGAAGYKVLSRGEGKTTLLGVLPEYAGRGIGRALQEARLREMARLGVERVTTNADRPATIAWYKRLFGYREIGSLKKLHSFGDPNVGRWTTLQMNLPEYMGRADRQSAGARDIPNHK
jgi:ribosomal-protein-alanine N-acetyltransferase